MGVDPIPWNRLIHSLPKSASGPAMGFAFCIAIRRLGRGLQGWDGRTLTPDKMSKIWRVKPVGGTERRGKHTQMCHED